MKKYNIEPWVKSHTTDELLRYRRRLAKNANARLRRIKGVVSPITGELYEKIGITPITYEYLKSVNQDKFSLKLRPELDAHQLRREIVVLENFLNARSGSIRGLRKIERERLKVFRKRGVGKFATTKAFYDFFNSQTYTELLKHFDSDKIIEFYEQAWKSGVRDIGEVHEAFEKFLEKTDAGIRDMEEMIRSI